MNTYPINSIKTEVKQINNYDGVNVVEFNFDGTTLSMMGLELPSGIKEGTKVLLGVKSSHVTIAKSYNLEVSYSNKIRANIIDIMEGKLLCNVVMFCNNTKIESLITKKTKDNMHLKVGDKVTVLIKSTELFIKDIIND